MLNVEIKNNTNTTSNMSVASQMKDKLSSSGGTLYGNISISENDIISIGSPDKFLKEIYASTSINNNLILNGVEIELITETIEVEEATDSE